MRVEESEENEEDNTAIPIDELNKIKERKRKATCNQVN